MAITDEKESDGMIYVTNLVSSSTKEAVIVFTWGDKRAQLTAEEARAHALGILECCEAAESDAWIVEFFTKAFAMEEAEAVLTLRAFRNFREARSKDKQQ